MTTRVNPQNILMQVSQSMKSLRKSMNTHPKLKNESPEQILAISQVCDDVETIDHEAFRQDMSDHFAKLFD